MGWRGIVLVVGVFSVYQFFFSKKDDEAYQTDDYSEKLSDDHGTSPIV